jgi:hypothetical protein
LIEAGADDFERDLLGAARHDRGSTRALQRTLAGLGIASTVPLGTSVVASAPLAAAGKVTITLLAKWLTIGAACGVVTVSAATTVQTVASPRPRSTASARTEAAKPAPRERSANRHESSAPRSTPLEPLGAVTLASPQPDRLTARDRAARLIPTATRKSLDLRAGPNSGPGVVSSPPEGSLRREVSSLDAAKSALERDAAVALAALDAYDRQFPNGSLRPEATVLRVRALLEVGRRTEAVELGQRFLDQSPNRAQASVIRALLTKQNP